MQQKSKQRLMFITCILGWILATHTRLQPIFPICLTASHRLSCSLLPRRLTVVFMCGPGLSRAVYIHGEAIWATARLSASAISLAAVQLAAGRWQHRASTLICLIDASGNLSSGGFPGASVPACVGDPLPSGSPGPDSVTL